MIQKETLLQNINFDILVSSSCFKKESNLKVDEKIILLVVNTLYNNNLNNEMTFFYKEFDMLFTVERREERLFIIKEIKKINIASGLIINQPGKERPYVQDVSLVKNYSNGQKIYVNKKLFRKLKEEKISGLFLNSYKFDLAPGYYTELKDGAENIIVDYFVGQTFVLIVDVIKPKFVKESFLGLKAQ